MYWNMKAMSPPRSTGFLSRGRFISGSLPWAMRWSSQLKNDNSTAAPAVMSQITGDMPSHSGALGFGRTKPHDPERSNPYTTRPSPSADSAVPTRSSLTFGSAGASVMRRTSNKITMTIKTSPANTHRHDAYVVKSPPMSGPTATAIAPADATNP